MSTIDTRPEVQAAYQAWLEASRANTRAREEFHKAARAADRARERVAPVNRCACSKIRRLTMETFEALDKADATHAAMVAAHAEYTRLTGRF